MLHRRLPINLWLLLAATLLLDLVATLGLFETGTANDEAIAVFLGMAYGQISLLCVWAVAERTKTRARWLAPVGAVLLVVSVMTWGDAVGRGYFAWELFATITCLLMVYVGPLLALLWFVVPVGWISRTANSNVRRNQISMGQILVVMTSVAVFLSVMRATDRLDGEWLNIATLSLANTILLIGALALLQRRWHLVLRIAACIALAIGICLFAIWTRTAMVDEIHPWAFFIVQAVVIAAWLAVCRPVQCTLSADSESLLPLGIA